MKQHFHGIFYGISHAFDTRTADLHGQKGLRRPGPATRGLGGWRRNEGRLLGQRRLGHGCGRLHGAGLAAGISDMGGLEHPHLYNVVNPKAINNI